MLTLAGVLIGGTPAAAAPPSTTQVLQFYAGTGTAGAAVPGPYASSPLSSPMGTAFDSQGNMFISTYGTNNCQVLKVTPGGTLSVFAGSGPCANATPGPATASGLNKPTNLAVDSQDNVYVTEDVGNRLSKITPGGTLSIVAGNGSSSGAVVEGPATQSPMRISGLALDNSDNIYLGDWVHGQILKVDTGGNLTIVAGNGTTTVTPGPARQSGMRGPYGVARDSQGNIYATDYYLHYVYKITPGGTLSIFAGNGGTAVPTPGPATSSALYRPWDVDVDASDNVYVSVAGAPSIVGITPGGTLSIVAGTGVSGTTQPGPATATPLRSITYMSFGGANLYYSDLTGQRVNRLLAGTPPTAPLNLQGTPSAGSVALSFDPPASDGGTAIQSYEVSTDDGANWATLSTSGSGPITGTVSNLTAGQTYQIRVRANNAAGAGTPSARETVAVPAGPPGAPTALQADPRHAAAVLTFAVPANDGGEPITSYDVSTNDGSSWAALPVTGTGATRTGTVGSLTDGQQYTVRVRARNVVGPGAASASVTVTPVPSAPGAPGNFAVQRGNASAAVAFDPPTDNGGSPVTSYDASTDDGANWSPLVTTGSTRLTGTISSLTNGQQYTVRVRARNNAGAGTPTAALTVTPATTPGAPGNLQATRGNGSAALSFTPPADTGGAPLTTYDVSVDDGANWQALTTSGANPVTGTVSGLTNGQQYAVRVRARNGIGAGTPSTAAAVVPATVPAAPTGVQATRADQAAEVTFTVPATGGSPITSYEASIDDGANWATLAVTGTGGTRTGTVSSLTNGQQYSVRVRARNTVGAGTPSGAATVTPAGVPEAPTGVSLAPGNGQLDVTFTPGGDNGSTIGGYEVSVDGGAWTALATQPATGGALTGTITGLVNDTAYQVRVRAVNDIGPGPATAGTSGSPAAAVPDAPTGLQGTGGNGTATLTFTPGGDNGSTIGGYEVSVDGGAWTALATQPATGGALTGTITGLVNGTVYAVRVRALNQVGPGAATAPENVTPVAAPAGPPAGLSLSSRDGGLGLRFTPPTDDGGSAVQTYQVSTDGGTTWAGLTTSAGTGGTRTATVTGLTNGVSYAVRVRAVTDAGPGAAGDPATGMPGLPAAPQNVAAVAGVSSITVSWSPGTGNDVPVTGYRVIADPGPATCRPAAGQTSCVLGAVAGQEYKVRVVAEAAGALETSSGPAGPVTPSAPPVTAEPPDTDLTLTTDRGDINEVSPGERLTLIGTGFAPYSTVTITLYSDPQVLATVTTDGDGAFRYTVDVPAGLSAGDHTLVAAGVDPDGNPFSRTLSVTVAGDGDQLPITGTDINRAILTWLLLLGVVMVALGSGVRVLVRRSEP
ncbi:fibronectin type III domain-containing protein [Actinoplanes sp. NPDC049265]|uniref:fibronectin type III domain-containing protein n=1 Tax=Actinoplanes sp. NPDC049265 TaxID=3363902 RepID=UPI0037237A8F